jgi:NAD(P)-dependent dehydrogenase (short-subunit alcohol dehydrogenase family)
MAQRALVTGASRGIGKAIALDLAKAGFDVALAARTVKKGDASPDHSVNVHAPENTPETGALPGTLEETAALVEAAGVRALPVRMDLLDLSSVEKAVGTVLEAWGGLDVVVNNGRHIGPGLMDSILDTPVSEYPKFLQAHGTSAIRIIQLALPGMLEQGYGTFVTITSAAGYRYYPTNPPGVGGGSGLGYRIGKAAGHTLVGSVLAEYGDRGIRAFNVNPGFVATERNALSGVAAGLDVSLGAPPSVIGAAVAWLVTNPDADALMRTDIDGQAIAIERALCPDWRSAP